MINNHWISNEKEGPEKKAGKIKEETRWKKAEKENTVLQKGWMRWKTHSKSLRSVTDVQSPQPHADVFLSRLLLLLIHALIVLPVMWVPLAALQDRRDGHSNSRPGKNCFAIPRGHSSGCHVTTITMTSAGRQKARRWRESSFPRCLFPLIRLLVPI